MTSTMRQFAFLSALGFLALATGDLSAQVANAGPDQTAALGADCNAIVTLDASATEVPEGETATFAWTGPFPEGEGRVEGVTAMVTLGAGVHEITLSVAIGAGEPTTDTVAITAEDSTPPAINDVRASPDRVWPPNHRMVDIEIHATATDNCDEDPVCEIIEIESNEDVDGIGDGNTSPDWELAGGMHARVRAERAGPGRGRVYTVRFSCTDDAGNSSEATASVRVPHNMGRGKGSANGSNGSNGSNDSGDSMTSDEEPVEPRLDRTRCVVKIDFDDDGSNRILAILDVSAAAGQIPTDDTATRLDDLEGYQLIIMLGDGEVAATFDASGRASGDNLRARWIPIASRIVIDIRDLDLAAILGINPARDGKHLRLDVPLIAVAVPPAPPEGGEASPPIVLFEDIIQCAYSQKPYEKGKGASVKQKRGRGGRR